MLVVEFLNYLSSLHGASVIKTDSNIVIFKYKGLSFLFVTEEDDQYYFRLMLPNIAASSSLKTKTGTDINSVITECDKTYKVVKAILWEEEGKDDSVWLSVEHFLYSKERANDLFARLIKILLFVIEDFRSKYINQ